MERKPTRSSSPTNIAILNVRVFDGPIAAILDRKQAEIEETPRYRDASYIDEDGAIHQRGGYWNDRDGRAVDGFTKQDVDDVRAELRDDVGIDMDFSSCDAMMAEYFRIGRLSINVQIPSASEQGTTPPVPSSKAVDVTDLGRDRYRVGGEVVSFSNRHVRCTCRPERCLHEVAARRTRRAWSPDPDRFSVPDRARQNVVRKLVSALRATSDRETTRSGRRPYSTRQRVLALAIHRLFKNADFEIAAEAAVRAGYFKDFPTASFKRFRADSNVQSMIARLMAGVAGPSVVGQVVPLDAILASFATADVAKPRKGRAA